MILLRPVALIYPVTQLFGENPDWYPLTKGHNGIDYGVPEGTPIRAAAAGVVTRAELDTATAANKKAGYGYHIRIQHSDDTMTIYGHLGEDGIKVSTGQNVRMGEMIGCSGNTGNSTGPHLHFEVRKGLSLGTAINPEGLIVNEIPPESGLFEVTITQECSVLNVRLGPTTGSDRIGSLQAGDKVSVYGFAGKDVWLMTKEGFIKYDPTWEIIDPKD